MRNNFLSTFLVILSFTFICSSNALSEEEIEETGLDNNGYLKILKVERHKKPKEMIRAIGSKSGKPTVYKAPESLDHLEILVEVLQELPEGKAHKVCIHYYDSNGEALPGASQYTEKDLSIGEIRSVTFDVPENAESFKVWLPEVKQ